MFSSVPFVHDMMTTSDAMHILTFASKLLRSEWAIAGVESGAVVHVVVDRTFVADGVTIGDRCKIQNNVSLYRGVTLDAEVFCGPSGMRET